MPDGELVTAGYFSVVYVCKCNVQFVGPWDGHLAKNLTVSWWI
jgi:hypothetical protein